MSAVETFTIGVFQDVTWAARGIGALLADGFPADSITIFAKASDAAAALIQTTLQSDPERFEVRPFGAVVARGPLVGVLRGTDDAFARTALAATFGRAGFQPHDGYIFDTLTGRGGVLVAIQTERRAADALAKLHAYGGGNAAIGAYAGRLHVNRPS
jgi:hypothetical protein